MFPTDDDVDISCLSFVWEALRLSQFKSDWPGGDRLHHYSPSAKTTLLSFLFLLRFMFCLFMKMTLVSFWRKRRRRRCFVYMEWERKIRKMGKGGIELRAHNGFLPHMGIPSNGPFVGAGIINRPPVFALRGKKDIFPRLFLSRICLCCCGYGRSVSFRGPGGSRFVFPSFEFSLVRISRRENCRERTRRREYECYLFFLFFFVVSVGCFAAAAVI